MPRLSSAQRPTPSAGASPRTIILWLASATFAIGITEFAAMTLLPYYGDEFGVSEPEASRAVSAYALGVVVGAPVLAVLIARWSRRRALVVMLGMFAVGNLLSALAPTLPLLIGARFLAGLPHGALFGVAMLVAASVLGAGRAAKAVAWVIMGLTVSQVVGVPAVSALGQVTSWRIPFVLVTLSGVVTAVALWRLVPDDGGQPKARPLAELKALRNPDVLLTLAMGAVGFGGMFAVYSYLSATLLEYTLAPEWTIPIVLMVYGLGSTMGSWLAGLVSGGRLIVTAGAFQAFLGIACLIYSTTIDHWWAMALAMILVGLSGGMVVPLQTRLMDVAGEAQTLAASMNHAAFNAANALGPAVAGAALAAGWGWRSTGWVGALLAVAGLAVWGVIVAREHRAGRSILP